MSGTGRSEKAKAAEATLTLLGGLVGIGIGLWITAAGGPIWLGSPFTLAGAIAVIAGIAGLIGYLVRATKD